ncbi:MAG: hypothetical protein ACLTQG_30660 [Hungatella sp.]|uniref:hypothetical protein n=1 Tax=Hungatella sp. TaxID=2613924 RepID=UPI0039935F7B
MFSITVKGLGSGGVQNGDDVFVEAIEEFRLYQARVTVIAEGLGPDDELFYKAFGGWDWEYCYGKRE